MQNSQFLTKSSSQYRHLLCLKYKSSSYVNPYPQVKCLLCNFGLYFKIQSILPVSFGHTPHYICFTLSLGMFEKQSFSHQQDLFPFVTDVFGIQSLYEPSQSVLFSSFDYLNLVPFSIPFPTLYSILSLGFRSILFRMSVFNS